MLEFAQQLDTLIAARFGINEYNHGYYVGRRYRLHDESAWLFLFFFLLLPFTCALLLTAGYGHIGFVVNSYGGFEITFSWQLDDPRRWHDNWRVIACRV